MCWPLLHYTHDAKRILGTTDQDENSELLSLEDLLDIFIMFAKLLVVEAKLIHKAGSHLLDLIV